MFINESEVSPKVDLKTSTWETNGIVDLRYLIAELGAKFVKIFERKGIYLAIKISPDLPRFFKGNAEKVKFIMDTIIKYNFNNINDGGVIIEVKVKRKKENRHKITMCVTASSISISPELVEFICHQITENQIDEATRVPRNLRIARDVTKVLGGDITVQSLMGMGTRCEVKICLETAPKTVNWN